MADTHGVSLLALRCDALAALTSDAIVDMVSYFDPDLVYIIREKMDMRVVSQLQRDCNQPIFHAQDGTIRTETVGGVSFIFTTSVDRLGEARAPDEAIPETADVVVCDELQMVPDDVNMDAGLDGIDHIARYQARTDGTTTFLTGALEASYDYVWRANSNRTVVRLPVRGLAPLRRSGAPELACLTCDTDGRVAVTSAPTNTFGLQALTNVGTTTAQRLKENGYTTRSDVASTTRQELRVIHGIGNSTAKTIQQSAQALVEKSVLRQTDATVPAADYSPLFVDIETDGLTPTIIWLIGVYDPAREEYIDFVDTDPSLDDLGKATRAFIRWLAAEYDRPSLVAWNGHAFDFKHLTTFISRHAPAYADYWNESVFEYDLYDWAVRKGNAILPGRTNRIEDVAAALDCNRDVSVEVIDGKTLARTIQRMLQSPTQTDTIDWNVARAYCEADVRELAAVYNAIANATPGRKRADAPTDDTTTQTGLLDF
ncbi:ribonuclease H-like domain-containing protein [Halocatena marina]|uniref:ribonuclease H-like domain-containing protein n=1 Tax=Halocatena marina TaxID=2934937 RepID=UPI00200C98C7|nr:ribonuclease H-like domain-containing protein [Halocatena marina]